jgi:hypothetical protein
MPPYGSFSKLVALSTAMPASRAAGGNPGIFQDFPVQILLVPTVDPLQVIN